MGKKNQVKADLSDEDTQKFNALKQELTNRLGFALSNAEVIRHCLHKEYEQINKPKEG